MASLALDQNFTNVSSHTGSDFRIESGLFHKAVLPLSVFIGLTAILGFFGNLSVLIVYSRGLPKSNFRYFVMSMAFMDLVSCMTTLPGEVYSQLNWYSYHVDSLCKIKCFFNVFTVWGSACILHILAYDRYRKVTRPLSWQVQPSQALKLCIATVLTAFIVSIPATILWGQQNYFYELEGKVICISMCGKSGDYSRDNLSAFIYIVIVYIGAVGVMVIVMTVLNILTAKSLFIVTNRANILKPFTETHSTSSFSASETSTQQSNIINGNSENNRTISKETRLTNGLAHSDRTSSSTALEMLHVKIQRNCCCCGNKRMGDLCVKTKSIIMFILSSVFIVTILIYLIMSTLIAGRSDVVRNTPSSNLVAIFVFWRLYFLNCVINPIIYGFTDPRFKRGLRNFFKK